MPELFKFCNYTAVAHVKIGAVGRDFGGSGGLAVVFVKGSVEFDDAKFSPRRGGGYQNSEE